ncbi:MAG: 30S ribosome-binding factor RbfA [Deltaproteobacteria bacterium]|nr:30S ribosome-binding factor RbfA [Deltaproteobacteria bacterium]
MSTKMSGRRKDHLGEEIRKKLGLLLAREVSDPRLATVTITAVKLSKDMSIARVEFSSYRQGQDPEELAGLLNKASGFLSQSLARSIKARKTPRLSFHYDPGFDYAQEMDILLKKVSTPDE